MIGLTGNSNGVPARTVGAICLAQFAVVLDVTIVTTALPALRRSLDFPPPELQWVFTGYTLVFGGFVIVGGRLCDTAGAERVFRYGLALFGISSAACGVAWTPMMLIVARLVQGLGAALCSPAALAMLTVSGERSRHSAIGLWSASAATGGASGWVVGGVLTELVSWRAVFWVNVPLVIAALLLSASRVSAGSPRKRVSLDVPGAFAITTCLALCVVGLSRMPTSGLTSLSSWALLAGALVLAVAAVVRHRHAANPLVPTPVVRSRPVLGGNIATLLLSASVSPTMYLAVLYVQQVMQMSPSRAALLFPVFNVALVIGSVVGPDAAHRVGRRRVVGTGFGLIALGIGLFAVVGELRIGFVLSTFVLLGLGSGIATVAAAQAGSHIPSAEHEGVAAGLLTASAQLGNVAGLAIVTMLSTAGAVAYRPGFCAAAVLACAGMALSRVIPARQHVSTERLVAVSSAAG